MKRHDHRARQRIADEIDNEWTEHALSEEEREHEAWEREQRRHMEEQDDLHAEALAESERAHEEREARRAQQMRDEQMAAMARERAAGFVREAINSGDVDPTKLSNEDYASYRRMKRNGGKQPTSRATIGDAHKWPASWATPRDENAVQRYRAAVIEAFDNLPSTEKSDGMVERYVRLRDGERVDLRTCLLSRLIEAARMIGVTTPPPLDTQHRSPQWDDQLARYRLAVIEAAIREAPAVWVSPRHHDGTVGAVTVHFDGETINLRGCTLQWLTRAAEHFGLDVGMPAPTW